MMMMTLATMSVSSDEESEEGGNVQDAAESGKNLSRELRSIRSLEGIEREREEKGSRGKPKITLRAVGFDVRSCRFEYQGQLLSSPGFLTSGYHYFRLGIITAWLTEVVVVTRSPTKD